MLIFRDGDDDLFLSYYNLRLATFCFFFVLSGGIFSFHELLRDAFNLELPQSRDAEKTLEIVRIILLCLVVLMAANPIRMSSSSSDVETRTNQRKRVARAE